MQFKKIILILTILIISANLVSAGLVAHYSFDGDEVLVNKIKDTSGNENDGYFEKNTKLLMSFDNQDVTAESGYDNNGLHYGNTRLLMSFDDVSPPTVQDESDYGNDGTITGATTTTETKSGDGHALDFDGGNSIIQIPNSPSFAFGGGSYTISAWVFPRSLGGLQVIWAKRTGGNISLGNLRVSGTSLQFYISNGDGSANANLIAGTLVNDEWQHVMGVVDRSTQLLSIYINGVSQGTPVDISAVTDVTNNQPVYIGKYIDTQAFNGLIDEVAVYSKALSPEEIQSLSAAPYKAKFIDFVEDTPLEVEDGTTALEFDGVDDYVILTIPNRPPDTFISETLSAWVSRTGVGISNDDPPKAGILVILNERDDNPQIQMIATGTEQDNVECKLIFSGPASLSTDTDNPNPVQLPDNDWVNIACTASYENGQVTLSIYKDGEFVHANSYEIANPVYQNYANRIKIGAQKTKAPFNRSFNGRIDEVAVYSKALSEDEIFDLFELKKAKFTDWTTDTPSEEGYALEFDGKNDYVDIAGISSSDEQYTATFWAKFDNPDTDYKYVIDNTERLIMFELSLGNFKFYYLGGGHKDFGSGVAYGPYLNEWHHYAVVFDSSTATLYIDGNSGNWDSPYTGSYPSLSNLKIMSDIFSSGGYFPKGRLDEVKIFDEALTPGQVYNEYNYGDAYYIPPTSGGGRDAPGFIPNLITILIIISTLTLLSLHNIRKK